MAAPKLFIAYRRDDSAGHAGRLFDRLAERFGAKNVFRDVDTLAAGEDFQQAVRETLKRCDVLLVLIGPRWLSATDEEGRWRLADENDLVRVEIASGLEQRLRVIPVLLQGAAMPKAKDLPGELNGLAGRNAVEVRDASFNRDVDYLISLLEPSWRHAWERVFRRRSVQLALAAVVALLGGMWVYPLVVQTPDKTRVQIVQMGLRFAPDTFVALAKEGDLQAVHLFLRAGMAPDSEDREGALASQWAAAKGHREMLEILLDAGADPGKALLWAAAAGQREIVERLLALKPDRATIGQAMHNAADTAHTEMVRRLLDAGADPNTVGSRGGTSALMEAASRANLATVALLLERGAEVNFKTDAAAVMALHKAVDASSSSPDAEEIARRLQVTTALLDKGADIDARERNMETWQPSPLLLAIQDRFTPLALLLIERGADVNIQTGDTGGGQRQVSALMEAAREGLPEVVSALLAKGARVDWRNEQGNTALLEAADSTRTNPNPEVARLLLAAGGDVNGRNADQRTALMLAARLPYFVEIEFVRHLLDHGAQLDAADKDGKTALMFAAERGKTEIARELIERGANRSLKDQEGRTAAMLVSQTEHKDLVNLLANAPAPRRKSP